ncbi:MAG: hypothetical protein U0869_25530, partial [Chloroflexota bacterium]
MDQVRHRPRTRRGGARRSDAVARTATAFLIALLGTLTLASLVGANGPVLPQPGQVLSDAILDPDHHTTPPPGWIDVRRPVIQDPRGPIRRVQTRETNIIVVMVDDMAETDERVLERLPTIRTLFL